MSDELKPCPFCGGEAEIVVGMHHFSDAKVCCTECYAESGLFDESGGYGRGEALEKKNRLAAASAWNKRADAIPHKGSIS